MRIQLLSLSLCSLLSLSLAGCVGSRPRDVNSSDFRGTTQLHIAAEAGDLDMVRLLVSKGANVNASSWSGTPLGRAAWRGHVDVVRFLAEKGADLNSIGNTRPAIHWAAYFGYTDLARTLLDLGADPNLVHRGLTPIQHAERRKHLPVARIIRDYIEKGPVAVRPQPPTPSPAPAPVSPPAEAHASPALPDVDKPSYKLAARPDDYALVVGVEGYAKLPAASFAEKDADAVKNHLSAMGIPPRNIIHLKGQAATRGALQGYIEEWLPKNVKPESTVFFYYSGHGAPDPKTGEAYLVPWDGDPMFLQSTAYPLKQLYSSIGKLTAREVILALDSCFSGAGGRSVLPEGARPLVIKTDTGIAPEGNVTLFTAASGDEITSTLAEASHGVFTYYFLRGLSGEAKDSSGNVTAEGLYRYLRPSVQDEAHRQNREQTPGLFSARKGAPLLKF